jgi:hypothetical protein
MDEAVQRFRRQAKRELGERYGAERRYSVGLRQAAVAYWDTQARTGAGLPTVAGALGVAPGSLRRWAQDQRFAPVQVIPDAVSSAGVTVIVEGERVRIEGLDVATAVALVARLR